LSRKSQTASRPPGIEDLNTLFLRCDIRLSRSQLELFWSYHQLLRLYDQTLNLTRIRNFTNMVLKLYVDSLLPGRLITLPSPLLDLGTGPGMPGVPLKISQPQLHLLLAESRRKRVEFLNTVVAELELSDVDVIGHNITENFEQPVAGVITRAVEAIPTTLERIGGCLQRGGYAIFMKGPDCDHEVRQALHRFGRCYHLIEDISYRIPETPHQRRLVLFERIDQPAFMRKATAMQRHTLRTVASAQNELFKDLKKLLTSRGVKKQGMVLVSGSKTVRDVLATCQHQCRAWISNGDRDPPPQDAPAHLHWYQLNADLFQALDVFGTHSPILLVTAPQIEPWNPLEGFPVGCSLLLPFQDPENVGGVIRSAAAFGVRQVILLAESAHPFHPKAIRASGGAVFSVRLRQGPPIESLPTDLPIVALSPEGRAIDTIRFPSAFGLLPGLEGPGLPLLRRDNAVSIPIQPQTESLNASVATAIALFVWAQRQAGKTGR
jgi:16S rRNA (guanine(527)-N(7))-methyltransferase RsmG